VLKDVAVAMHSRASSAAGVRNVSLKLAVYLKTDIIYKMSTFEHEKSRIYKMMFDYKDGDGFEIHLHNLVEFVCEWHGT
jgi:hypothetical protein